MTNDRWNDFVNPPAKYRGAPFWAWNTKIEKEVIKKQIPIFAEMGFGGYHVHVRVGMDTPYMSEEYLELVKECKKTGEEHGLRTYLYDEDRWPSGFGGGKVTEDPKYRMKHLLFTTRPYSGQTIERDPNRMANFAMAVRSENGELRACYDIVTDEKGCLKSFRRIAESEVVQGTRWYAYVETNPVHSWYNDTTYVDVLSKDAIDCFIQNTHEKYREVLGENFGKTIPSIFTDEPHMLFKTNLKTGLDKEDLFLTWTEELEIRFKQEAGKEIWDCLPEIFWEKSVDDDEQFRYIYHKICSDLFEEAFSENIGEWCREHNIDFTGHYLYEETLEQQTRADGDLLRMYRHMDVPGMDLLFNMVALTTGKQIQSIVRQFGKKGAMSEEYGVTNWSFDFRSFKFQGDWQAALGITLRVPHLSMMSMEGEAKRDFPASIFYQAPWYKQFKHLEDHFARINVALEEGCSRVRLGIIHPLESYWIKYGPEDQTGKVRAELEEHFQQLIQWLLINGIDFDYISEGILAEQKQEMDGHLCVGDMAYTCVVVPGCITLRETTWKVLEQFAQAGGSILNLGEFPQAVNGKLVDGLKENMKKWSRQVPFEKMSILSALSEYQEVCITEDQGKPCESYIHQMKWSGENAVLFLAPAMEPQNKDDNTGKNLEIRLKGIFTPVLLDTMAGDKKNLSYRFEDGDTIIEHKAYGYDTLLISLQKSEEWNPVTLQKRTTYKLEEKNVCVLDKACVWLDGKKISEEEEILRLDDLLRKKIGLPLRTFSMTQPYTRKKEIPTHKVLLKYQINSKCQMEEVFLALEQRAMAEIWWNGQRVLNEKSGWYIDEKIEQTKLGKLNAGVNILEVQYPFGDGINLEAMYLLGDFGVLVNGSDVTLTEQPETIAFISLSSQEFGFYGGSIRYQFAVDCPNGRLRVKAGRYRGAMLEVYVDGRLVGDIILPPYVLEVRNLEPGQHKVELRLLGNRYNTLNHFHLADSSRDHASFPYLWRTKDKEWTYEYRLGEFGILEKPEIWV